MTSSREHHIAVRIKFLRRMRDRPEGFGRMNMRTLARHQRRKRITRKS